MENKFFSKEKFISRLKELRGSRSQDEIARALGIFQQKWQRIESGKNEPNLSLLVQMSVFFGVSIPNLLGLGDTESRCRPSANLITGLRTFRKEMEAVIARANTFLESINKLEAKLGGGE